MVATFSIDVSNDVTSYRTLKQNRAHCWQALRSISIEWHCEKGVRLYNCYFLPLEQSESANDDVLARDTLRSRVESSIMLSANTTAINMVDVWKKAHTNSSIIDQQATSRNIVSRVWVRSFEMLKTAQVTSRWLGLWWIDQCQSMITATRLELTKTVNVKTRADSTEFDHHLKKTSLLWTRTRPECGTGLNYVLLTRKTDEYKLKLIINNLT